MPTSRERRRLRPHRPGARERTVVLGGLVAIFIGFVLVLSTVGARAAPVFKVDDVTDFPDATPGDGKCASFPSGSCTLRAAVQESDVAGGEIVLPAGTYHLTISSGSFEYGPQFPSRVYPEGGDLDVSNAISIKGEGPGKTVINGLGTTRIFDVHAKNPQVATSALGVLKLEGVRLTQGFGDYDSASGHFHGGAIHNHGEIDLSHVVVDNSSSPPVASTTAKWGGGGITNAGGAKAALAWVTIAQNRTEHRGGGLENLGSANLSHVTFAQNTAPACQGGGLWMGEINSATVLPSYTLIAQNTGGDCSVQGGRVIEVYTTSKATGRASSRAATTRPATPGSHPDSPAPRSTTP